MPVRMLFTHWRDLTRLRRATLLSSWKNHSGKLGALSAQDVGHLLKVYNDFVHSNQPPDFPNRKLLPYLLYRLKNIRDEGSFKQYLD